MSAPSCDGHERCITCGDEGVPMEVVELRQNAAVCIDEAGAPHEVAIDLVAPVETGHKVLVHAGVAIGAM